MQLNLQPCQAASLAKELTDLFSPLAASKNINLLLRTPDQPITFYCDLDKIQKILYNLLSNAIKFSPSHAKVMLSLSQPSPPENAFPEGAFTISVRDTGPGIAAKELPFIFDRFRQVDSSSKKFYSGTGIGLALVKEFTELHHGSVSVKSEEGFGSEFVIKLPLGREIFSEEGAVFLDEATDEEVSSDLVLPEEPPAPLVAPEHSAQSETLLIVEDNAEVRAFVRNCIEGAFVIVEAEDGVEGLEKAHHEIPDLIISDLYMPNMDGNAFTEKIKQDPELGHIPLIILTSSQEQESLIEGLTHGADVYMKKPFYANELNIRIRNLLQNRNRVREHARRQLLMSDASTQPVAAHQPFLQKAIETVKAHLKDQFFNVDAFAEGYGQKPEAAPAAAQTAHR